MLDSKKKKPWKVEGFIDMRVRQFEKRCLIRILRKAGGNIKKAALLVDIRRTRLYRMMRRHGLKVSDFRVKHTDNRQQTAATLAAIAKNADSR